MSFLASRAKIAPQGIGKSVPRREDARLLTGKGRYASDMSLPGQAYAYFVRSPHAHASIVTIDATEAAAAPGVIAVLTGRDAATDGLLRGEFEESLGEGVGAGGRGLRSG